MAQLWCQKLGGRLLTDLDSNLVNDLFMDEYVFDMPGTSFVVGMPKTYSS